MVKKESSTAAPVYLYVNLPWDEATGAMKRRQKKNHGDVLEEPQ